ncbi:MULTISPECIES: GNAT family N-acetyltransferase [Alteromonadaceae]|uniref:GNAT family N-acetyltransferase n=1 Tax=Alteromonadaceae TaxID=72275 RepID=UPI002091A3E5|nr:MULTISPECIES: GNAT family N-acetyltransferase [Aliiglaciecola]MDO6712544.1 GNAT family N-acetyltransferase [Aliiglaciecola sp. 2_MG-2023]MDO6753712.1 GNAT family N-acetyltransferase [Aliiglaciecola sp. 1_MG-2023]
MENISIRKAIIGDLEKLIELEQKLIAAERPFNSILKAKDATYYDIENLITSPSSYLAVAEFEGEIIATGYAQIRESKRAHKHDHHVYLGFMFVAQEYRGQGINKRIMQTLIAWGREQNLDDFYLDVYATNESAIKAYRKAGFAESTFEMKLNF